MHKQCVPGAFPFFLMARIRLSTAQTLVLCPDPTLLRRKGLVNTEDFFVEPNLFSSLDSQQK